MNAIEFPPTASYEDIKELTSHMPDLTWLGCANPKPRPNDGYDYDFLRKNKKLQFLSLSGVKSLSFLTSLPFLAHLEVRGPYKDINDLSSLKNLRHLEIYSKRVKDLSPLNQLDSLISIFGTIKPEKFIELERLVDRGVDIIDSSKKAKVTLRKLREKSILIK